MITNFKLREFTNCYPIVNSIRNPILTFISEHIEITLPNMQYEKCSRIRKSSPLGGTHLVAVRELINQEVPTRVRQQGELN